eukprot:scaffold4697_cov58-Phaeocystis_antarctica.AAC.6
MIKRHTLGVAQVLKKIRVLALAKPLDYHLLLLRKGQWLKLHVRKVLAEPVLIQASGARRNEHDVALRSEDLRHVPLNLVTRLAAL